MTAGSPRAERPFVDRPVVDRDRARDAATRQAVAWGLPVPAVLRHGMNSLYLTDGVVLRVGRATAPAALGHELVRHLLDAGVPTIEPIEGLAADVDGFAVTAWKAVREVRRAIDWRAVGRAVRLVHSIDPAGLPSGYPVPDPSAFPWWRFEDLLAEVGDEVDPVAGEALHEVVDRHRGWEERVRQDAVLCHGDVHPGNVLVAGAGDLLVDWDLMCVANPAWDHAMLTTYARPWGGDPAVYRAFSEGYGRSYAADPLAVGLGELRNVAATLLRVKAGRHDPAAAAEAERRLAWWRGEHDASWRAQ